MEMIELPFIVHGKILVIRINSLLTPDEFVLNWLSYTKTKQLKTNEPPLQLFSTNFTNLMFSKAGIYETYILFTWHDYRNTGN